MPIYSQICSLVSEEKIFEELICIIIGKTAMHPDGGLVYRQSKFADRNFGRGSLDDHLCQSTVKSVH